MYFRNLTFYRIPAGFADTLRALADGTPKPDAPCHITSLLSLQGQLSECAAQPCGSLELRSRGWVSPYGRDAEALFAQVGDCILLTLGGEEKILPGSAVNAELAKRIAEREQREGRKLPGRTRKALRDDVLSDLLPRALVKPYRLSGYIDLREGFVAVDTSSRKAADDFVSKIRETLGSFPALPLNAEMPPRAVLTGWIIEGPPDGVFDGDKCIGGALYLDDSATLEDAASEGGKVTLSRLELAGDEIKTHLDAGMQCTRLGLTLDDRLSFTFGEDLVARKLKILDAAAESLDSVEREDLRAEIDARFALLSGEVRGLFCALAGPFRFSTAEE